MTLPRAIVLFVLSLGLLACAGLVPAEPLPPPPPPLPGTEGADEVSDEADVGGGDARLSKSQPDEGGTEGCDPCSLLMNHDFDDLQRGRACELCGDQNPKFCEAWPSEAPACATYDKYRNCIYARLGYGFETSPEWKEVFADESWYQPDPRFTWNRVTSVQKRNARTLRNLVKRKRCAR